MKIRQPLAFALMGIAMLSLGVLFKYQHWSGASMLVVFGTLIMAVSLVVVAIIIVRYSRRQDGRIARMEQQRVEQERLISELRIREEVGRDMHDDLGAGLSAIRLRSEMAQRNETDPDRRAEFAAMGRQAEELIANMRQLIWSMTTEEGDLHGTVDHCLHYARSYLGEHQLRADLQVAADLPQQDLAPEQRRHIFLLVKEALHNTVKHAEASMVRVAFAWQDGLSITLHDDGRGLPPEAEGSGRGLTNMRSRAEALGGRIEYRTENGTRITVHIPLASGLPAEQVP